MRLTLESGRGQVNTGQDYQTVGHEAVGGHAKSTDAEKLSITRKPTHQLTNTLNKQVMRTDFYGLVRIRCANPLILNAYNLFSLVSCS